MAAPPQTEAEANIQVSPSLLNCLPPLELLTASCFRYVADLEDQEADQESRQCSWCRYQYDIAHYATKGESPCRRGDSTAESDPCPPAFVTVPNLTSQQHVDARAGNGQQHQKQSQQTVCLGRYYLYKGAAQAVYKG